MRWALVLAAVLLSQACVNQMELAKQSLESTVITRNTITYRNLQSYPGNVVCGEFTTRRSAREDQYKPFVYRSGAADARPSTEEIAVFCSTEPQHSLHQITGINYAGSDRANLLLIRADYALLADALEQYETDNFGYPRSNQGTDALVAPSDITPRPRKFKDGGYLSTVPLDPWGAPYLYTGPVFAGVKGSYTLLTLGADGREGGVDSNADVELRHMLYLDHIDQL